MREATQSAMGRIALTVALAAWALPETAQAQRLRYTEDFLLSQCAGFSSEGSHPYWVLEPGFEAVLEGREGGATVRVVITVTDDVEVVDGVETRVVVEAESEDGETVEISRNFFAICNRDNSVVYFGEDVDNYKNGVVDNHDGSWRAGVNGARAGVIMPGTLLLGGKYFQEIARDDKALDRAEIVSMDVDFETPAGTFSNCLRTRESSPLEPGKVQIKHYAPGIGLIQDAKLKLVSVTTLR